MKLSPLRRLLLSVQFVVVAVVVFIGGGECADTDAATTAVAVTAATNAPTATGDIMVGTSYCTWGPDTTCYANGWPACCTNGEEVGEILGQCIRYMLFFNMMYSLTLFPRTHSLATHATLSAQRNCPRVRLVLVLA